VYHRHIKDHLKLIKETIMATSLADIRAKLQAQENRKGGQSQGGDNAIYPHWNIAEGSTAKIRFLPDGNSKNDFFWVERLMIRLPFAGIKGQADSKPVIVQVPCVEMYGDACPVLAEVRTWFKDKSLEEMGRKYWKKKSYLFQGFVRENPLGDDKTPENPIRRFVISPQIFNLVRNALMDPDMESMPTDYTAGLDFTVKKTSKGGYADYSTSNWARKESSLTSEEQAAVDAHGLFNLGDFLPKKPSDVELKVIKEMFEASVDGQPYDTERWGQYFRPAGVQAPAGGTTTAASVDEDAPAPAAKPALKVAAPASDFDEDDAPAATAPVAKPAATGKAEDILAMIRARQQK
jgi:hypothetical protein